MCIRDSERMNQMLDKPSNEKVMYEGLLESYYPYVKPRMGTNRFGSDVYKRQTKLAPFAAEKLTAPRVGQFCLGF